jgi:starch phosphorylase
MASAPTPPAYPDDPSCAPATPGSAEALHKVWTSCLKNADVESLRRSIAENLKFRLGVAPTSASPRDVWMAVAYTVRDLMVEARFKSTTAGYRDKKWVGYLSMEFLIGRLLVTNLHNLGLVDAVNEALSPSA